MKSRWVVALALIAAGGAGVGWWLERPQPVQFLTTPAAKGDVLRSIVATGTVNPVVTVQVGTYVSGPIQSIVCNYNTKVKAGQLCVTERSDQQARLGSVKAAEAQRLQDSVQLFAALGGGWSEAKLYSPS